jgi:hypothetical protein
VRTQHLLALSVPHSLVCLVCFACAQRRKLLHDMKNKPLRSLTQGDDGFDELVSAAAMPLALFRLH